jgi:hypothetical protein
MRIPTPKKMKDRGDDDDGMPSFNLILLLSQRKKVRRNEKTFEIDRKRSTDALLAAREETFWRQLSKWTFEGVLSFPDRLNAGLSLSLLWDTIPFVL